MNRDDDELLRVELEALERAAPTAEPPDFRRRRWRSRMPALAGAVVLGLVAAVGVSSWLLWARPPEVGTASPSPTQTAPATPTGAEPTAEPTATATAEPTPEPTTPPDPTAAPRSGWAYATVLTVDRHVYAGLRNVVEARGRLYAIGRADERVTGIWVSDDGSTWMRTDVPAAPDPYVFLGWDLVDTGERLVVLAPGGYAAGSGYFTTMVYISEDGLTWRPATSTPGIEAAAQHALVQIGDRLLAVGHAVWTSDDGGETWLETLAPVEVGGRMQDAAARDDLVVAVGQAGSGDVSAGPMYAWLSTDAGATWRRTVVDQEAVGLSVAIDDDGTIVALGGRGERVLAWTSLDDGLTWTERDIGPCCARQVVATPTGFVIFSDASPEGTADVLTSTDGLTWLAAGRIDMEVSGASFGPRFGLVAAGGDTAGLGPHPFP